MTCLEIVEQSYLREPSVTLADALSALVDAGDRWESLPEGGEEMCAAFSVATVLWALAESPKLGCAIKSQCERACERVHFFPSVMWRTARDAFRDDENARTLYFILRDSAR